MPLHGIAAIVSECTRSSPMLHVDGQVQALDPLLVEPQILQQDLPAPDLKWIEWGSYGGVRMQGRPIKQGTSMKGPKTTARSIERTSRFQHNTPALHPNVKKEQQQRLRTPTLRFSSVSPSTKSPKMETRLLSSSWRAMAARCRCGC